MVNGLVIQTEGRLKWVNSPGTEWPYPPPVPSGMEQEPNDEKTDGKSSGSRTTVQMPQIGLAEPTGKSQLLMLAEFAESGIQRLIISFGIRSPLIQWPWFAGFTLMALTTLLWPELPVMGWLLPLISMLLLAWYRRWAAPLADCA